MKIARQIRLKEHRIKRLVLDAVRDDSLLFHEFKLLFDRRIDDPCMALARARRLLEVVIIDQYIECENISMPPAKQLPNLYDAIETLGKRGKLNIVHQALSHLVRVEGNRAVHYRPELPNYGKSARVTDEVLESVISGVCELFCTHRASDLDGKSFSKSIFVGFANIYSRYEALAAELVSRELMTSHQIGCTEMLIRSLFNAIYLEDIEVLERCSRKSEIPSQLDSTMENAYLRLRNAGLITHDQDSLFVPVRSTRALCTERAKLLLALSKPSRRGGHENTEELMQLVRKSVSFVEQVISEPEVGTILRELHQKGGDTARMKSSDLRLLRNSLLVANDGRFLMSNPCVKITHLGYYCLGKFLKD